MTTNNLAYTKNDDLVSEYYKRSDCFVRQFFYKVKNNG